MKPTTEMHVAGAAESPSEVRKRIACTALTPLVVGVMREVSSSTGRILNHDESPDTMRHALWEDPQRNPAATGAPIG